MNPSDLEHWLAARPPALAEVIRQLAAACAEISRAAARSGLDHAAGDGVVQGLAQRAEQCVALALGDCKQVAGFVTDDQREPVISPEHGSGGAYLVLANPLEGEGAGALAGDGPLGTLFSVLPHLFRGTPASPAAFMQPGRRQVAAGYAIYGPRTVLVLSAREGVQMFTLEPGSDRWLLTQDALAVPATGTAVAVDPRQPALLGKAGAALRGRMRGRPERAARPRLHHALVGKPGGRRPRHLCSRRRVARPARTASCGSVLHD